MFKAFSLWLCSSALIFHCTTLSAGQADESITTTAQKKSGVVFSTRYKNLTAEKAYALQKAFVKNSVAKGAAITGFKAGLTNSHSAEKVGLEEPITGVLLTTPHKAESKPLFRLQDSAHLMLEQELAFRMGQSIREKVTEEQVRAFVSAVAPAIELPDVTFLDEQFNGLDIIANNALAYQFIVGGWKAPDQDLDTLAVSLSCGGQTLAKGQGSNALGGQWKALSWMVNHLLDQGYSIQKDQILITGNLGKMVQARPCRYHADYGVLGQIEFSVEP